MCDADALWRAHPLASRMGLDHGLRLFENLYHGGAHRLRRGRLQHAHTGSVPLVIHFNGGSKVELEAEWQLPWDAAAGATPVRLLQQSIYASFGRVESARATAAFEARVAFLDTRFRRTRGIGPLNFSCQAAW